MANGAFKFKDNSGNVVSFISGSGPNISFSGGTLDLSGMTGLTLGNLTMSGTTQNAVSTSHAASYLLTSSFNSYTGTTNTIIGSLQTSTGSLNTYTSSANERLNSIEGKTGSYATTGSNTFNGNLTVTGYIDAQELRTTYISSSILYRSGSTKFGDELTDTHAFSGSVLISGSLSVPGSNLISGSSQIDVLSTTNIARLATTGSNIFTSNQVVSGSINIANGSVTNTFNINQPGSSTTEFHLGHFSNGTYISNNYYYAGGHLYTDNTLGSSTILLDTNGIYLRASAPNAVPGNHMFISGSGQIGIGRIDQTKKLDIYDANPNGTDDVVRVYQNVTTNHAWYRSQRNGGANMIIGATRDNVDGNIPANASLVWNLSNHDIVFGTNNIERVKILNGGDLLITGNGKFLQAVRNTGGAIIDILGIQAGTDTLQIKGGTSGASNSINFYDTGGLIASFYNSNFGIGTSTPSSKLSVHGQFRVNTTNSDGNENRLFFNPGGAADPAQLYLYNEAQTNTIYLTANGASYFNSGNIGINTDSPTQKLHVAGYIRTNGVSVFKTGGSISGFIGHEQDWLGTGTSNDLICASEGGNNFKVFTDGTTAERITATSTGYVYLGKGWSATNHRINLEVAQGNNILVVSAYAGASNDSVLIKAASGANPNAAGTVMQVTTNSSTGRSISAGGTINASGNDYAEYMLKATTETINKGDIVGVNIDGKLTNIFNESISFVVKSTDPSYVGGDNWFNDEKRPSRTTDQTEEEFAPILADFESRLEIERAKVDRIAFSGQVPVNVTGATVGDYIIPIETEDGKITGQAITNPSFDQYKISVGKVWKIMEDGRAFIAIKIG